LSHIYGYIEQRLDLIIKDDYLIFLKNVLKSFETVVIKSESLEDAAFGAIYGEMLAHLHHECFQYYGECSTSQISEFNQFMQSRALNIRKRIREVFNK